MKIWGITESTIDFNGRVSLVIFMAKCPLLCPYCHNSETFNDSKDMELSEVFEMIDSVVDFIDAVVISGGEPLLQLRDVKKIFKYAKSLNLETKLDTCACYPEKLDEVLDLGLVDYVAMDVKAPFDKYDTLIKTRKSPKYNLLEKDLGENVKKSMDIVNKSEDTFLECRTTYVPKLMSHEDIIKIAHEIDCDSYVLQQFRNRVVHNPELKNIENPKPSELEEIAKKIKPYFESIRIKTAEFGEELI